MLLLCSAASCGGGVCWLFDKGVKNHEYYWMSSKNDDYVMNDNGK
ncbi:hypothetical protein BVRB_015630 [Beta vulgaris subsp. vulgaris]|uniref:Uncharacterized protein n=1 Tax=Beta vulgaris subsp. vulgaris TaxID=3555 RepID=A0A0J8B4J2_BETVV|nr:hypothetical protein BVRB_015630 [Beta vulgaris subsp. vulgaris]